MTANYSELFFNYVKPRDVDEKGLERVKSRGQRAPFDQVLTKCILEIDMDHRNNASIDWVLKASASSTLSPSPPSATTAPKSCRLIVGPVAFLAQIVLLVVVILALIIKR